MGPGALIGPAAVQRTQRMRSNTLLCKAVFSPVRSICGSSSPWLTHRAALPKPFGGKNMRGAVAGAGFACGRCNSVLIVKLPFWVVPVLGLWPSWQAMPALGKWQQLPLAGAGASSAGPAFLCVHIFLLLLLSAGRKNKFPAKEVGAQSPEVGWWMMPRCADMAAPHFAIASFPSNSPTSGSGGRGWWGGWLTAGPSPVAGSWGVFSPCS